MNTSQKRWIVRYDSGRASSQEVSDLLELLKKHSFAIVDDSLPKMALVTGSNDSMTAMKDNLAEGWSISREQGDIPVPDARKKIQ